MTAATADVASTAAPPTTDDPITDAPSIDDPTTAPIVTLPAKIVPVTAAPVTAPKTWVLVAQFTGLGDKESNTFTITGALARVSYKASDQFSLDIDTGDPNDDTAIGSCPAGGCTKQGPVLVAAGGWYLHVIAAASTTAFAITVEEYR